MKIAADRVTQPGRIFKVDKPTHVLDAWTLETCEIGPDAHFLTLGCDDRMFQFYLMESGLHVCVDEMDAVILELVSEEII